MNIICFIQAIKKCQHRSPEGECLYKGFCQYKAINNGDGTMRLAKYEESKCSPA